MFPSPQLTQVEAPRSGRGCGLLLVIAVFLFIGIGFFGDKLGSNNRVSNENSQPSPKAKPTASIQNQPLSPQPTPPRPVRVNTPDTSPVPPPPLTSTISVSPSEHYNRGLELWVSNRAAAVEEFRAAAIRGGHPDAYYYLGLNFAEGRDPRTLQRAELVAAMQFFQNAEPTMKRCVTEICLAKNMTDEKILNDKRLG